MGKDSNGKELGTGIIQRRWKRWSIYNRFGQWQEVKSRGLKELKTLLNIAIYEDVNNINYYMPDGNGHTGGNYNGK